MQVYQNALKVRRESFGSDNIQVALAHEDLAYATYVNEYSSGISSETTCYIFIKHVCSNQESLMMLGDMQSLPLRYSANIFHQSICSLRLQREFLP